jgi:hypothetical protein
MFCCLCGAGRLLTHLGALRGTLSFPRELGENVPALTPIQPKENIAMKTFLAVYLGSADSRQRREWDSLDEATRQKRMEAGMKAWHEFGAKHQAVTVVEGGPLGKTKKASAHGVTDTKNNLTGYTVVKAESHEAAAKMFENHPHFTIFPGESVEIMEILPVPGR